MIFFQCIKKFKYIGRKRQSKFLFNTFSSLSSIYIIKSPPSELCDCLYKLYSKSNIFGLFRMFRKQKCIFPNDIDKKKIKIFFNKVLANDYLSFKNELNNCYIIRKHYAVHGGNDNLLYSKDLLSFVELLLTECINFFSVRHGFCDEEDKKKLIESQRNFYKEKVNCDSIEEFHLLCQNINPIFNYNLKNALTFRRCHYKEYIVICVPFNEELNPLVSSQTCRVNYI